MLEATKNENMINKEIIREKVEQNEKLKKLFDEEKLVLAYR